MKKKIIKDTNVAIFKNNKFELLENYSILINENIIEKIDKFENIDNSNAYIINAKDKISIPGLINTHHHLSQSLTRGMKSVQNSKLFDWLLNLYKVWKNLSYDALYISSLVSLTEIALYGCTTSTDICYLFPQNSDAKLDAVIKAANDLGIRFHAGRGSMSLGQSKGGLPPDINTQDEKYIIKDCLRVIEKYHDKNKFSMLRIDLAPCAPFSVSKELMIEIRNIAKDYNLLCHTHLAETIDEEIYCLEKYNCRPVKFLENLNWLGNDVYLAHCVHLNNEEIKLFSNTKTSVAHCPSSNMRLGSGIPPIIEMLKENVNVGIGVDGSSSNDSGNILGELRMAMYLQRVKNGAECMSISDVLKIGTINGAKLLNREDEIGSIQEGKAADISIFNLNTIEHAGAYAQDPLGALILCNPNRADTVIVNGEIIVDNKLPVKIDIEEITFKLNKIVKEKFMPDLTSYTK